MWGLFALRTRHPPPCSSSVYRGSTRGAGEGVEKNASVTPCHLLYKQRRNSGKKDFIHSGNLNSVYGSSYTVDTPKIVPRPSST